MLNDLNSRNGLVGLPCKWERAFGGPLDATKRISREELWEIEVGKIL